METLSEADLKLTCGTARKLLSLSQLLETGNSLPTEKEFPSPSPNDLRTLSYTSGSSGTPKGVMLSEKVWHTDITSGGYYSPHNFCRLSFQPLSHTADRLNCFAAITRGGRVAFYSGEVTSLFDDLKYAKPTIFNAPPRLWAQMYSDYAAETEQILQRMQKLNASESEVETELKLLRHRTREKLGGRVARVGTGSAPTSHHVKKWMAEYGRLMEKEQEEREKSSRSLCCYHFADPLLWHHVGEGYGTTEAGGIASSTYLDPQVELKLVDVPELGYTSQDKPFPRGEICVKTTTMFSGYFKDPKRTAESFTEDGYYRTGDIGQYQENFPLPPNLIVIDRRSNIFKLAQGEFICPETLELRLLEVPIVSQIFLCGDSLRSYVVCIIVPQKELSTEWAHKNFPNRLIDFAELCSLKEFRSHILNLLTEKGIARQMQPYEIPKAVHLECDRWTALSGLLTPNLKLSRPNLKKHYTTVVEKLYQEADSRLDSLEAVISAFCGRTVLRTDSLSQLGIDSLSAMRLAEMLKNTLRLDVPIHLLFEKYSIRELEEMLTKTSGKHFLEKFERVTEFRKLSAEIQPSQTVKHVKPEDSHRQIFLTGANGFLGIFLLCDLLLRTNCDSVICLIRSDSVEEAKEKLRKSISDYSLEKEIEPHFQKRVRIICGDLALARFGLSENDWDRLCSTVTSIIHCGAVVNAILPLSAMLDANVSGTEEVIRLASTHIRKPLSHISTLSVLRPLPNLRDGQDEALSEDQEVDLRVLLSGYAISKGLAEDLVRQAISRGLRAVIVRPASIGGDRVRGICNPADYACRVLSGICQLGLVPDVRWRFNIIPADFAAAAIVHISKQVMTNNESSLRHHCFHLANLESVSVSDVAEALRAKGVHLHTTNWDRWLRSISSSAASNPLFPLLQTLPRTGPLPCDDELVSTRNTDEALSGSGIQCEPLDEKLISLYFKKQCQALTENQK